MLTASSNAASNYKDRGFDFLAGLFKPSYTDMNMTYIE